MDAYRITNEVNEEQKCNLVAAVSACFGNANKDGQQVDVYNMIYGIDTGFQPFDQFATENIINAVNVFCNDMNDKSKKAAKDDEKEDFINRLNTAYVMANEIALMRDRAKLKYRDAISKVDAAQHGAIYDKLDQALRADMFAKMNEDKSGCFIFTHDETHEDADKEWKISYTDQKPADFVNDDADKEYQRLKNKWSGPFGKATPYVKATAYAAGTTGIAGVIYVYWNYIQDFFNQVWGYMPSCMGGGNTTDEKASYSMAAKAAMFAMFTIVVAAIFYAATTDNAFAF